MATDISIQKFVDEIVRVEHREYPARNLDISDTELVDEVSRLGIVTEPTKRAIDLLVRAFGVADRPSVKDCIAAAEARGARPECVAARWGYLPSAMSGGRPWIDVELDTDDYALIRWDDGEIKACLFLYRMRGGGRSGRLGCRVSRCRLQRR